MEFDDGSAVRAQLGPDETLLWSGRPALGVRLQAADFIMIPFSLMWGGFAFFWEFEVVHSGHAPIFFMLWGIPFVLIGIYLIIGRFFWDAYQRGNTYYAVTSQRLLFVRQGLGGKTTSLPLRAVAAVEVGGAGPRETITFGSGGMIWSAANGWPGSTQGPPSFVAIEEATGVANIIRRAIQQAA